MSWLRRAAPATPPADRKPSIPRGAVMVEPTAVRELERDTRDSELRRLIHRTLWLESLKPEGERNAGLVNFLLDARSIIQPSAPGSEVLREGPPVPIGYAVPVIPGRAS